MGDISFHWPPMMASLPQRLLAGFPCLGSPFQAALLGSPHLALGKHTDLHVLLSSAGAACSQDSSQDSLSRPASQPQPLAFWLFSGLNSAVPCLPINSSQAFGALFCNPPHKWVIVRKNQHLNLAFGWGRKKRQLQTDLHYHQLSTWILDLSYTV